MASSKKKQERTLILVKPDGVARSLIGTVLARIEARGLRIIALKMLKLARPLAAKHYSVHRARPFFGPLLQFITSGPCVAAVVEGPSAVSAVRGLLGATDCLEAAPGTIRGDLGLDKQCNLVHGSDSAASARREIAIFFRPSEIQRGQQGGS